MSKVLTDFFQGNKKSSLDFPLCNFVLTPVYSSECDQQRGTTLYTGPFRDTCHDCEIFFVGPAWNNCIGELSALSIQRGGEGPTRWLRVRIYYVHPKPLSVPESGERPGFVLSRFPLVSQSLELPIRRSIPAGQRQMPDLKFDGQAHFGNRISMHAKAHCVCMFIHSILIIELVNLHWKLDRVHK